ncbi:MAG: GGDEF domain-containing protein [Proteobacteria bacterium]|nr:GGDEF domain-containing protein [Pseudomonadota bacterium]
MNSKSIENTPLILSKFASLTAIRDIDAYELSFLKTLTELLKVKDISIYKFNNINTPYRLVHYSTKNASIDIQVENIKLPDEIKEAHEKIQASGKIYKNKHNLIVYPIIGFKGNLGYLAINLLKGLTEIETKIISSLLNISHNYYSLLEENQKDKLTGLLNRKTFDDNISKIQDILNTEHQFIDYEGKEKRADKNINQFWLAIFDIDHFKRINDNFGHVYGDEVLLLLSQLMKKSFRANDLLFRFGGEEFISIVQVCNKETAEQVLERFRKTIESFDFPQVGQVTISSGVTQIMEKLGIASDIVGRADQALYYAKEMGRNRLYFYESLVNEGLLEGKIKEGDIELF